MQDITQEVKPITVHLHLSSNVLKKNPSDHVRESMAKDLHLKTNLMKMIKLLEYFYYFFELMLIKHLLERK